MAEQPDRASVDSDTAQAIVLSKATVRAADHFGISNTILGSVLGLSEASVSRLKRHQYLVPRHSKSYELALLFVRLFRSLDSIMGGDDEASRSWLRTPNTALRGRPIDLIATIPGLTSVVAYVDSRRGRI